MSNWIRCIAFVTCAACVTVGAQGDEQAIAVRRQAEDLAAWVAGLKATPPDLRYNAPETVETISSGQYMREMAAVVHRAAILGLRSPLSPSVLLAAKESLEVMLQGDVPASPAGQQLMAAYIGYGFANLGVSGVTGDDLHTVKLQAAEMREALTGALREFGDARLSGADAEAMVARACVNLPVAAAVLGDGGVPRPADAIALKRLKTESVARIRDLLAQHQGKDVPTVELAGVLREVDLRFIGAVRVYPLRRPAEVRQLVDRYVDDLDAQADAALEDFEAQSRAACLEDTYGQNANTLEVLDALLRWVM